MSQKAMKEPLLGEKQPSGGGAAAGASPAAGPAAGPAAPTTQPATYGASSSPAPQAESDPRFTQVPAPDKMPSKSPYLLHKQVLYLALALYAAQIIACSLFCWSIWWVPRMFTCARFNPTTWDHLDPNGNPVCLPAPSTCSPMQMSVILDITITNALLVLYWWVGDRLRYKFSVKIWKDIWGGRQWQKTLDKRNLQELIEPPSSELSYGSEPGTKLYEDNFAANKCKLSHPVHSQQWNQELIDWQYLKSRAGKYQNTKRGLTLRKYGLFTFFFFIGVLVMYLVLAISPKHYHNEMETWTDFLLEAIKDTVIPEMDGAYTILIVIQFCLELFLFIVAAVAVKWPMASLIRSEETQAGTQRDHNIKTVNRIHRANQAQVLEVDEHPGLIQDTCLLIACHKSCITSESTHTFANTLRSALKVFPPKAIFVCDNSPSLNPWDRTQQVCESVSRSEGYTGDQKINYVYIPEGNKSHAMYWTTEYWIPELVRRGESVDFQFCMMIDDDVPLPPDLHVPLHTLDREKDIKAVCYVIRAATESGDENTLVNLQDAEYKLAGLVKQAQWRFGTTLCCHGAIALWRRDVLGKQILWHHDTEFHGEDMYMGLLLHRLRKDYAIMVSAGAVVPTYAPEDLVTLFRQRTASWDLCAQRKFTTQLRELFGGLFSTRTWILKPFMVQELISVCLDYMRLYLYIALGQRNPVGLLLCFIFFYMVLYLEIIIFNCLVLRDRGDLRLKPLTIFLFPFYRTLLMFIRVNALFVNIILYHRPKRPTIAFREDNSRDLPPCPPMANPDWFTVWHVNPTKLDESVAQKHAWRPALEKAAKKLCKELNRDATQTHRLECFVQAHLLLRALTEENATVEFPACLSEINRDPEIIEKCFKNLAASIDEQLRRCLGLRANSFIRSMIREKAKLDINLYTHELNEAESGDSAPPSKYDTFEKLVEYNHAVLVHISELIYNTRYPKSHDEAAKIKVALRNLMDLVIQRKRMTTQKLIEKNMGRLERVQRIYKSKRAEKFQECLDTLDNIEKSLTDTPDGWKQGVLELVHQYRKKFAKAIAKRQRRQLHSAPARATTTGTVTSDAANSNWPRPKLSDTMRPLSGSNQHITGGGGGAGAGAGAGNSPGASGGGAAGTGPSSAPSGKDHPE